MEFVTFMGMDKSKVCYKVEWYSVDGTFHTDFFTGHSGRMAGMEVSYVHEDGDPEVSLRRFLTHVPLHNLSINII